MKPSRRATTLWHLFFHYFNLFQAFAYGLLFVPLYLKHIPVDIYGYWLATGNIISWLTLVDPGVSTVLQQRIAVAYGQSNLREISLLTTSGILLSCFSAALFMLIAYFLAAHLGFALGAAPESSLLILRRAFLWASLAGALQLIAYGTTSVNLGLQSSVGVGLITLLSNLSAMLATIVLLTRGYGLLSLPYSSMVRSTTGIIASLLHLLWHFRRAQIPLTVSLSRCPSLFRSLSYTLLGRLGSAMASNVDALLLARLVGPTKLAAFTFTRRPLSIARMLVDRPTVALMPAVSHLVGTGEITRLRDVLQRVLTALLWTMGLIASGFVAFNSDFLSLWIGERFFVGTAVCIILAAGFLLEVPAGSFYNLCVALGDIHRSSLVSFVQSAIFVVFFYALSKHYGLYGAAGAPLCAVALVGIWYYPRSLSKLLSLTSKDAIRLIREGGFVLLASALVVASLYRVRAQSWNSLLAWAVIAIATYGALALLLSRSLRKELTWWRRVSK